VVRAGVPRTDPRLQHAFDLYVERAYQQTVDGS